MSRLITEEIDKIVSEAEDKAGLVSIVKNKLSPGEHIVWSGQPNADAEARRAAYPAAAPVGFTLAVVLLYLGFRGSQTALAPAFISPSVNLKLILLGVGILILTLHTFTRPDIARKGALRTLYAVTNQQLLLLLSDGPGEENAWQWQFVCYDSSQLLSPEKEVEKVNAATGCIDLQVSAKRHLRSLDKEDCKAAKNAIAILRRNNVGNDGAPT